MFATVNRAGQPVPDLLFVMDEVGKLTGKSCRCFEGGLVGGAVEEDLGEVVREEGLGLGAEDSFGLGEGLHK